MTTTTAMPREMSASGLLAANVRIYLQVKNAFEQCDDEIKDVITDLLDIVNDQQATHEEQQRAMYTIVEALFPNVTGEILRSCQGERSSVAAQAKSEEIKREEATFSDNLAGWMRRKGLTQEQLASKIGVGQSAIANMLNRNARPQRKTVRRLAEALEIAPQDLWPCIKVE